MERTPQKYAACGAATPATTELDPLHAHRCCGGTPLRQPDFGDGDEAAPAAALCASAPLEIANKLLDANAKEVVSEASLNAVLALKAAEVDPLKTLELANGRFAWMRIAVSFERVLLFIGVIFLANAATRWGPAPAAVGSHAQRSLAAFKVADENKNGYLDPAELERFEEEYDAQVIPGYDVPMGCRVQLKIGSLGVPRDKIRAWASCVYYGTG